MNTKKRIPCIAIALLLVSTLFSSIFLNRNMVSAHSGDLLTAWASVTPTIDGVISPAEWDDADSMSFLMEYSDLLPETLVHGATIYVKNDETYLYLAVVIEGDDYNTNDFSNWRFDNDNDGTIEVGDDGLSLRSDGLSTDRYRTEAIEGWWSSDVYDGGTNDTVGAVSHTNPGGVGDYTFEYRHPLDTADDTHDFSLKPGDTVGFQLVYVDGGPGGGGSEWPEPPDYGDIVVAGGGPRIVEGPGVSEITNSSALISWDTDKESDSVVKYDKAAGKYDFEKIDPKMVRNHRITLTDLEPSTVYHFMVQSADSGENTVESRDRIFETLPLLDEEDPSVLIEDPGLCTGITEIVASAFDNIGVDRVEFYLEDELMFIDYSSPFVFPLNTLGLENRLCSIEAKAFDRAGRIDIDERNVEIFNPPPDIDNPSVSITHPSQGDTLSGIVEIQIHAVDTYKDTQQSVSWLEIYVDDTLRHSLARMRWWQESEDAQYDYSYSWDTQTVENGEHSITAMAYDDEGNSASDSITVTVDNPPPPRPLLDLTRGEVTRHGNYFTVELDVENVGTMEARNIVVRDSHWGFQCLSESTADYDVVTSYSSTISCVEITFHQPLSPGESCAISLQLIPILFDQSGPYRYLIGDLTSVTYEDTTGNVWTEDFSIQVFNPPADSAFSHADYLIVTNPDNLFTFNPAADVNNLLSTMAELAMLKNGVLGYFYVPASVYTSFDRHDRLACGDVDGDGRAEIIVAEDNGGRIDIYSATGWEGFVGTSFDENDLLACGDVEGDGEAEIIVAEDGGDLRGLIEIYKLSGLVYYLWDTTFDRHDRLACGDVDGDGRAEIIVAEDGGSREGWIDIYNIWGLEGSIHSNFDENDLLACGDVEGDGLGEIIVAEDGGTLVGWIDLITYEAGNTGDSQRLRDLIEEGGAWSSQLRSDWTSNGYLLIVGETEIVPSWASTHDVTFLDKLWIHATDLKYANTIGNWLYPELSIGRIIGNNASELIEPIQASINVDRGLAGNEFDRSTVLAVSGWSRCLSGHCDNIDFASEARDVANILQSRGTTAAHLQMPLYGTGTDPAEAARIAFFSFIHAVDPDVIHLAGHGNPSMWDVITVANVTSQTNLFGDVRPFIFASSCLTGKYTSGFSIAEAFLTQGAAVYIGATEISYCCYNTDLAKDFYRRWDIGEPIGLALKQTKRAIADSLSGWHPYDSFYKAYLSSVYQLYGDPKYGWQGPSATSTVSLAETTSLEPLSSLDVVVPDYEVTTIEGEDYVEIPDGDILIVPDMPLVPFYTISLDYPKGYEVNDVILTNRSGLTATTGLNIPNATLAIAGEEGLQAVSDLESPDWWPEGVFNWIIFENPDGSTTLVIAVCPFYYNPQTTDIRFYKNYSFDINYTVSTVEISKLETDKHVYEEGEQTIFYLELNNSAAEANDVLVDAVIKAESTGEIVDGLLLRTLKNLTGLVSFTPQWDTTGFEPGYYYVEATLKEIDGNVLDRKTEFFRLGATCGEITSLAATPEYFDIGDDVEISMKFNNTGTVNITGVAVARIVNSAGHLVEEFTQDISDLTPYQSISFSATWNTSEAEEGSYNVVSYVLYDGKSTALATAEIQTPDLIPPSIVTVSQEPQVPDDGEQAVVSVEVTDEMSGVRNVTLSYSTDAGETWNNASMEWTTGDIYEGEIPGLPAGTNVQYQIIAYDYANNSAREDNAGGYYIYLVIPEFAAWTLLLIILIVFTAAIAIHKRRLLKTPIR